MSMRVFFALEPDVETQRAIADWRDRFARAEGMPVPAANFHLTLAFVGDVDNRQLDTLCRTLDEREDEVTAEAGALALDQVGFWPGPDIYWMGCSEPVPELASLSRKLQHLGSRVGAKLPRKPFTPHVTLYRRCLLPPPAPVLPPAITLAYNQFALLESVRGRSGVSYHALAAWELQRRLRPQHGLG